ncbi:Glycosyl transferase, family 14 [Corchorus capsularis]|uniref:Glycosyl transferase, family 14 n=1 Tax=Corchorus capsularis TaxID=210143 RepID=A0A1R3G1B4_COCAP|nr:Glycosyl transferase, family 14 [Corchorus capsularis]
MIEAERRLLANALLDFSNQRFVLLSEACIPLFNFSTVYNYLINSNESFVESYDLEGPVGRGRYNRKMRPQVTLDQWRKGAQWFEMDRDLATEVVSDQTYFPVFQKHCKGACYSDEHYLPTFVTMKYGSKNSNRTLTWVDWSKGGPHPAKFLRTEVTVEFLERLRSGSHCRYKGNSTNVCHLFARKFSPDALYRLLKITNGELANGTQSGDDYFGNLKWRDIAMTTAWVVWNDRNTEFHENDWRNPHHTMDFVRAYLMEFQRCQQQQAIRTANFGGIARDCNGQVIGAVAGKLEK